MINAINIQKKNKSWETFTENVPKVLLHFDDVRAACHNVISCIYEKYILFDFHSDLDSEITPVRLEYIPKDFALLEEKLNELGYDAVYLNSQGDMLFFGSTPYKYISQADHEHYEVHDVLINHYGGQFFSSTDERFPNMLYWQAETGYYYLQAPLAEDEMIKIAEGIFTCPIDSYGIGMEEVRLKSVIDKKKCD